MCFMCGFHAEDPTGLVGIREDENFCLIKIWSESVVTVTAQKEKKTPGRLKWDPTGMKIGHRGLKSILPIRASFYRRAVFDISAGKQMEKTSFP